MYIKLLAPRSSLRPMDSLWKTRMSPPLALLVLAGLTPDHHTVSIQDENIARLCLDDHPDLVGITVKVDTLYRAIEIARRYRARGIPVIMGGIHPTVRPEDCLCHADAVVVGEAENLWETLLQDAEQGRLQRLYRHQDVTCLSKTPVPRWDLIRGKQYLFTNTLCIGRGCPWKCDFCYNSSPNITHGYRMKPIASIIREIKSLHTNHVMFIDDNFIGNPRAARDLITRLRDLQLTWHTAVSADIGNHDELLDLMAESGCKSLFIGFESVNQHNLQCCHKAQNRIEKYDETIGKIHARGMMVNASLVFGFDGDDATVFETTVEWLVRNRTATMTAHILTPYPGTRLHDRLAAAGRIVDRDLTHYNTAHAVFQPAKMSRDELESGYRDAYRRFYSWANILRRWPSAAGQTTAYLEFNLLYRKWGKATSRLGLLFGMRNLAILAKALAYPAQRRRRQPTEQPWPGTVSAAPS